MTDKHRINLPAKLAAAFLAGVFVNMAGATITFVYFAFVESSLTRATVDSDLIASPYLFILVMLVVSTVCTVISVSWFRYRHLSSRGEAEGAPANQEYSRVRGIVNLPLTVAFTSLFGWVAAGILYGFVPPLLFSSSPNQWIEGLRIFFGIAFVGAPFTVVSLFLILEGILRDSIVRTFPSHLLTHAPDSVRINVLPKMLLVSLMIGTVPVTIVSAVTLSQIYEVHVGRQSMSGFLLHMPSVIGFLLILAVVVAVGLSFLVARSVSEPLRTVGEAMDRIRKGDLDVSIPVVSNDEIGRVSEGFNRMVGGLRDRDFIRDTFGSYLSPEVVSEILESKDGVNLGGELRDITILVSDLRGFTSLSAAVPPEMVVTVLNLYLEKMVHIIRDHGGTIDEFTGDGILAFFGAPKHLADSEVRAVKCAVAMQEAMPHLNQVLAGIMFHGDENAQSGNRPENEGQGSRSLLALEMGIAVNSGSLIVGNIGCRERKKYGAVGSPINIAFRMEKRSGRGEILISSGVHARVGSLFTTVPLEDVSLAGIQDPITLHRVVASGQSLSDVPTT